MRRVEPAAPAAALLALGLWTASARAGVETDPPVPVQGEPATVTVTNDLTGAPLRAAAVTVVYRPGSKVSHAESLGTTDARGRIAWTPADAGIVTLTAIPPGGEEVAPITSNLSVRFRGIPLRGLAVMVLAGIILYGGVIRGFRSLGSFPHRRPPDT